jgi:hypothetical protein
MLSVLFFILDNLSDVEDLCACRQRNEEQNTLNQTTNMEMVYILRIASFL